MCTRAFRNALLAASVVVLLSCAGGDVVSPGPTPVATVTVSPAPPTIIVGASAQLTAITLDAAGNGLTGRVVTWSSSNPAVDSVSANGLVTGLAVGGPVTITATSEGKNGTAVVTTVLGILTGIKDIRSFLDRCPTNDTAYASMRQDFELRLDGQVITAALPCVEPFPALPIAQLTDELIIVQALRTAYYMSIGTEGRLPWTQKSLYAWMKSNVAGINLKSAPGGEGIVAT